MVLRSRNHLDIMSDSSITIFGGFGNHGFVSCTTGGLTTATFDTGPGDHYYIVVPTDGITEGSYGLDSGSVERPAGDPACANQALGSCP